MVRFARFPAGSHIRKVNPRALPTDQGGEVTTLVRRILRRGIPYGTQSSSTPTQPADDGADRGLLFLSYQTSIVDQFEFVTKFYVNSADFKQGGAGFDPIIGQNAHDPHRRRSFRLHLQGESQPIEAAQEWVIPTGGGYFFAPSLKGLRIMASFAADKGQ